MLPKNWCLLGDPLAAAAQIRPMHKDLYGIAQLLAQVPPERTVRWLQDVALQPRAGGRGSGKLYTVQVCLAQRGLEI